MDKVKPVFSFVGSSGSGKTTFIEKLIPVLTKRGYRVGAIKHDAHKFELDKPGKDSYRMKAAGAEIVTIVASDKMGMMRSFPIKELSLEEIIINFFGDLDIVITEGYKQSKIPKFEIYRKENNKPPVCFDRKELIGVITSDSIDIDKPVFGLEDVESVADKIISMSNFNLPQITIEGLDNKLLEDTILNILKGDALLSGKKNYRLTFSKD
jgi:molybdopterin-guanine dinucleotide biosynthesis protein B